MGRGGPVGDGPGGEGRPSPDPRASPRNPGEPSTCSRPHGPLVPRGRDKVSGSCCSHGDRDRERSHVQDGHVPTRPRDGPGEPARVAMSVSRQVLGSARRRLRRHPRGLRRPDDPRPGGPRPGGETRLPGRLRRAPAKDASPLGVSDQRPGSGGLGSPERVGPHPPGRLGTGTTSGREAWSQGPLATFLFPPGPLARSPGALGTGRPPSLSRRTRARQTCQRRARQRPSSSVPRAESRPIDREIGAPPAHSSSFRATSGAPPWALRASSTRSGRIVGSNAAASGPMALPRPCENQPRVGFLPPARSSL
jgi:hypothetical protein